MNRMTKLQRLIRRAMPGVFAIAMLSFTAISTAAQAQEVSRYECRFCEKALATSTPTQTQGTSSFDAFGGFRGGVSVGVAAGQTVRVMFRSTSDLPAAGPSDKPGDIIVGPGLGGHVRVFNAATGALLWSRDITSLTAGLNIIDINRNDLPETGNPRTGRVQLLIEVLLFGRDVAGADVRTTFEVFDNENGRTTVSGQVRQATLKMFVAR